MARYVYTNDFLFHAQESAPQVFHDELRRLLAIPFQVGLNAELESIVSWRDAEGRTFSRDEFYAISGIRDVANCYYLYDMRRIMDASWKYFTSRFPRDTVIIGSELGLDLRTRLTELGYTYVNFWFHPYKLLDDIFFLVGSNSREIFKRLERYRVPVERMRFYSSYYSVYAERKGFLDNLPIEENCCVFAGQTFADKSIQSGDRFLNITDFADRVAEVAKKFSKIYYVPHPSAGANPDVEDFLKRTPSVQLLTGVPTYYLLASPRVKKVMALSSSVLYEAETFGKEVEYLFRPMFDIDAPYSLNSFVSIYQSYFAPSFWRTVLSNEDGETMANDILLDTDSGKFRDMMNSSFGFRHLGRLERMDDLLDNIRIKMAGVKDQFGNLSSRQDELASQQAVFASRQDELASQQAVFASQQAVFASRQDEFVNQHTASAREVAEVCVRVNELWAWADCVRNSHAYRFVRQMKRIAKAGWRIVKPVLPYGFICMWLRERRGIVEDLPLLAYPEFSKRLRRIVKFALPYGFVTHYKRVRGRETQPCPVQSAPAPVHVSDRRHEADDLAWKIWQRRPGSVRDRVAVFSPMPPNPTGIANYSAKLHQAEPNLWDVFCGQMPDEDYLRNADAAGDAYNVMTLDFYRDELGSPRDYRALIFVVGNNDNHHRAIIEEAVRSKDTGNRWLYLHEAMLHNAVMGYLANTGMTTDAYLRQWYPEKVKSIGQMVLDERVLEENGLFGVRPLVELSGIENIIVNNSRCLKLVLEDLTPEQRKRVRVERMFLPIDRESVERSPKDGCSHKIVGTFGTPHAFKGTNMIARAVAALNGKGFPCKLVVAGYNSPWYVNNVIPPEFRPYCIAPGEAVDPKAFRQVMADVDLAVQLRIMQHGESSGCINELLGLGVPVLTNRGFVDKEIEPYCQCTSAHPTPTELEEAIRSALVSYSGRPLTDEMFDRYSFRSASKQLFGLVVGGGGGRSRKRYFVDATLFDGHGIARSSDFLYGALRKSRPDIEVVYLCSKDNPYRSQAAHRVILIDCANRDAELMRILASERPDYVHFPSNGRLPDGIDAIRETTKVISTIHDLIPMRIPEVVKMPVQYISEIERWTRIALDHSDVVFCDSEFTIRDVCELMHVGREKLHCLYFAPMLRAGEAVSHNRFGSRPFFLYNGGYCPRKGIDLLVKNFMHLRKCGKLKSDLWMTSHPNPVAIGDAELFAEGVRLGWIRELGYVSDNDLQTLFHDAVGMVYPSLYEGFGLPPLEAMNAGCPSIVARTSSLPEVCGDAVLWLENRNDTREFQEALVRLESDKVLRRDLIQKGKSAAARFTWENTVEIFLSVVEGK